MKDLLYLEARLMTVEQPHLERIFADDQRLLDLLMAYRTCRKTYEKLTDDSLWRRIETEDAIWSTWNDGYRLPENRPDHAGSIENEQRIKDFENDLKTRVMRRELLRKAVRKYEVHGIADFVRCLMQRSIAVIPLEGRFPRDTAEEQGKLLSCETAIILNVSRFE